MHQIARKNVALNGCRTTVVQADCSTLQRGHHVPAVGVNLVICDLLDAGLLGGNCLQLLQRVRQQVARPGAVVMPASATVYAMGLQLLTGQVLGFDFSPLNRFRWSKDYQAVLLEEVPHLVLTEPQPVLTVDFTQGSVTHLGHRHNTKQPHTVPLQVLHGGVLNAVVSWFDLHLDEQHSITAAPAGFGMGGARLTPGDACTGGSAHTLHLGQALHTLDCALPVKSGSAAPLAVSVGASGIAFSLPDDLGVSVPKSPWMVRSA